jgi:hypothetical protein
MDDKKPPFNRGDRKPNRNEERSPKAGEGADVPGERDKRKGKDKRSGGNKRSERVRSRKSLWWKK